MLNAVADEAGLPRQHGGQTLGVCPTVKPQTGKERQRR
jgi:hypothetical protein